jgi:hypothetical protein
MAPFDWLKCVHPVIVFARPSVCGDPNGRFYKVSQVADRFICRRKARRNPTHDFYLRLYRDTVDGTKKRVRDGA